MQSIYNQDVPKHYCLYTQGAVAFQTAGVLFCLTHPIALDIVIKFFEKVLVLKHRVFIHISESF